jgi:hypothetical protein
MGKSLRGPFIHAQVKGGLVEEGEYSLFFFGGEYSWTF